MSYHNPKHAIEQLQVILSNPAKKIGFLFGAGISAQDKLGNALIPTSTQLLETVEQAFSPAQESAILLIKTELGSGGVNIETLLSKLSEKCSAVGTEILCGLNLEELTELRELIENEIKKLVSVHSLPTFDHNQISHLELARWIKNCNKRFPIEIFTTNYDYLLELSLESQSVPYFDGFIGSYKAFFHPEWIEDDRAVKEWTKLWKLHGSLGWAIENNSIIRVADNSNSAMIYPSYLKYDHSRKQPYLSYMDRLSTFIKQEDSVLFISGYSFGDDHINNSIVNALDRSRSSHVFVLKRSDTSPADNMATIALNNSKISVYAKRNAVIGGKLKTWQLPREPNKNESYNILDSGFDEDATEPESPWTGQGNFTLGDFTKFTKFLSLFYTNSKHITA